MQQRIQFNVADGCSKRTDTPKSHDQDQAQGRGEDLNKRTV
jgi:hypothetical protein